MLHVSLYNILVECSGQTKHEFLTLDSCIIFGMYFMNYRGAIFSPHEFQIPELNTANLTEETFTPKIDRNLRYLNMFGY